MLIVNIVSSLRIIAYIRSNQPIRFRLYLLVRVLLLSLRFLHSILTKLKPYTLVAFFAGELYKFYTSPRGSYCQDYVENRNFSSEFRVPYVIRIIISATLCIRFWALTPFNSPIKLTILWFSYQVLVKIRL